MRPPGRPTARTALFAGLVTVDLIQRLERPLAPNEKVAAREHLEAAGGPATNAAVAFAHLGGRALLATALGAHPVASLARWDLEACGVELVELAVDGGAPPPISAVLVSGPTGERAVATAGLDEQEVASRDLRHRLPTSSVDIVLVDAHLWELGIEAARLGGERGVPVVLDGGSYKPGTEALLGHVDVALCSADFAFPGGEPGEAVLDELARRGVVRAAVTRGAAPILWRDGERRGEVPVPAVEAVDTLAAGDVFHGAFCAFHEPDVPFETALGRAAAVAAESCRSFGTRAWMAGHRRPG